MANIREQHTCQIMYANDHNDMFAVHNEGGANEAVGWIYLPPEEHYPWPSLFSQMKPYMADPDIMACPLLRDLVLWYSDASYVTDTQTNGFPDGGGWNTNAASIWSGYCWFANIKDGTVAEEEPHEFDFTFDTRTFMDKRLSVHEPPWPTKVQECDSNRAFIAHAIIGDTDGRGGLVELSHGSSGWHRQSTPFTIDSIESIVNPVGYGDGHVDIHQKSQLRPRARSPYNDTYIY